MSQKQAPQTKSGLIPFLQGGISGMTATCIIQPIDMVKVRIQLKSEKLGKGAHVSPFSIINEMLQNGKGIRQFYKGLDSALIRQMTYTTTRMGIYKSLLHNYQKKHNDRVPMSVKSLYGISAGFIGSLTGNPADLILVRLQSDQTLPKEQRRNYTGFLNAFQRIIKEEGVLALWKGASPTVVRAMVLNFGMLAPFDEVKERLNIYYGQKEDTLKVRLMAAAVSGFFSSFLSLPFDNAKTKMQKMVKGADGKYPYKNIFDTIHKSYQKEGFTKLWVGFPTFYARIAPHVMLTWIIMGTIDDYIIKPMHLK